MSMHHASQNHLKFHLKDSCTQQYDQILTLEGKIGGERERKKYAGCDNKD